MKIQQSAVDFQSSQLRSVRATERDRVQMWVGPRPRAASATGTGPTTDSARRADGSAAVSWSAAAVGLRMASSAFSSVSAVTSSRTGATGAATTSHADKVSHEQDQTLEPRMQTLVRMIESITGMVVRTFSMDDLQSTETPSTDTGGATGGGAASGAAAPSCGMVLQHEQTITRTEQLQVQAQGQVQTADGRSISFQMNISLSMSSSETQSTTSMAGNAATPAAGKDPLVIHFDGPVGELRNTQFSFDLNSDGQAESIPFVGQGSGFLVLDANHNGQVDNGSELFGPQSGDGFTDLARWDQDGNGWIDEADAVFTRLQVWRMDAAGQTSLQSLAAAGVGALYLGRVSSEMTLNDPAATPPTGTHAAAADGTAQQPTRLGQLRSTGLYLTETGQTGALQQIDLVA